MDLPSQPQSWDGIRNGDSQPIPWDIQNIQYSLVAQASPQMRTADQSTSRVSWGKNFARARNRLLDQRARVSRSRLGLQEKRLGLRRLRQHAGKLDAAFLSSLRRVWAKNNGADV